MTNLSLRAINRNVQRLSLLLEDLLTISSMEGKGRRLNFQGEPPQARRAGGGKPR
jgi:hypothetical protein